MHSVKWAMHNLFLTFCILHFALCITTCSVPNLEKPQCTEARNAVKRFYSLHVGGDMRPSAEKLGSQERFLTSELFAALSASIETAKDYFTATENYPKAFRVGECASESETQATLQVLLLWRDDNSSDQREVRVETIKIGDSWLLNKVSN